MLDCLNGAEHAQSFKCFSIMPAHQLPIQSAAVQAVDSEVVAGIINEGHAEELWKVYILCFVLPIFFAVLRLCICEPSWYKNKNSSSLRLKNL